MASKKIREYRLTLGVFVLIILAMFGGLFAGTKWSDARWDPQLGLDLAGGTQIVLEPVASEGEQGAITDTAIREAISIMRKRVDSSGFSEAQISSQSGRNIVVELPGDPEEQKETRELVRQSAKMQFRPVLQLDVAVMPEPEPTAPPASGEEGATDETDPNAESTESVPGEEAPAESEAPTGGDVPAEDGAEGDAPAEPEASGTDAGSVVPQHFVAEQTPAGEAPAEEAPAEEAPVEGDAPAEGEAPVEGDATEPSVVEPTAPAEGQAPQQVPGAMPENASDPAWITPELTAEFAAEDCSDLPKLQARSEDNPDKAVVTCDREGFFKYILGPVEVEGSSIGKSYAGLETNSQGQSTNRWAVFVEFEGDVVDTVRDLTGRLVALPQPRNQFSIVLDGLVLSAPRSQAVINNGSLMITGDFTQQTATDLANQLQFGALPLSFEVQTEAQISALLGMEQLKRGLLAGVIGLLLVVLYSLFQYRLLGLVTVASLLVAGALTYAAIALLGWSQGYRLSMAGVTGLIVAIGITVDSFIVYFERIRDELRDGRPLASAVDAAWSRARRTIIISDCINFLAAAVLYFLSVGGVKGFAFTLGLTTLIDLVIVMLFTHPVIGMLARTRFFSSGHPLSGFSEAQLTYATAYAGRGRVRSPEERAHSRMTLAERRRAEQAADHDETTDDDSGEPLAGTAAGDSSAKED